MMFLRGAVLDGAAGITYATLQCIYEIHDRAQGPGELRRGGA